MGIIRDDNVDPVEYYDQPPWVGIFFISLAALVFVTAIVWLARLLG